MDKETLSNYGWIVICVLVLAVMIALATPFGGYIRDAFNATANGLFDTNQNALDNVLDDLGVVPSIDNLAKKYTFTYYAEAQEALNAINGGTIGQNPTANAEDANVATYVDENGLPWLVLLKDQTVTYSIDPKVDMGINLGGHSLYSTNLRAIGLRDTIDAITVTIDGRLPGSFVQGRARSLQAWKAKSGVHELIVNGGTYMGWTSQSADVGYSDGIFCRGILRLNNATVIGLSSGVEMALDADAKDGEVRAYINNCVLKGYSHGGLYYSAANTTGYIKDTLIEQIAPPEGYSDMGTRDNKHGMYIGSGSSNMHIYMDNCTIKALPGAYGAFKFRDSGGEKNNTVYMSNMKLSPSSISITPATNAVYIGTGCGEVSYGSTYEDCVVYTNETYTQN